ncbi:hypothetical protein HUO14_14570 [Parasphingorhabdus flavimaris]|uniref:Phospholipase D-like domain-containing protein n=1 Tax=Parasphingorhabdus flavimaris TaxID=266812 RepID=A0ABX2N5X7_9SPHN|nr:hypothetical protein [Parasphingorhabdus flavimaris]NVD29120.1 hypothetical protein [Parasphingorhabdus flavimaris]
MKYYDVFGEPGYHSVFLTTFSFTAQAFEDIPFSKLRGAGCRNVSVLTDQSMLNLSIEQFGTPRFAGSLYHLAKVSVPGAFHPKITLLLGENKGRLLIGSANLTALGIAGNKELITDLVYTPEEPSFLEIFRQAFEYIASYTPPGDPWLPIARERALKLSPWLFDDGAGSQASPPADVSLIINRPTETILEQVATSIGDDEIQRLIVMSPYWDQKLEGLRQIREVLGMPPTDVLLERSRGEFPKHNFKSEAGIELFDVEEEGRSRFNHAKLIVAFGRDWDHVISGSMNCTIPALLGNAVSKGNAEAGLYKRVVAGTALARLGLEDYRQAPLDSSSLAEPVSSTVQIKVKAPVEPGTFQLRGSRVSWTPPQDLGETPICVSTFNSSGESPWDDIAVQTIGETSWFVDLALDRPRSARLQLADGSFSAAAAIIDVDVLAPSTLPSTAGKKAKIADRLLGATDEDLALVGFLAELETIELDEIGSSNAKFNKGHESQEKDAEARPHVTLTYEDFVKARERVEAAKEKGATLVVGRGNRAADLVSSCLNRLIGLVSRDLSEEEGAELQRVTSQDPTHKEPSVPPGQDPKTDGSADSQTDDATRAKAQSRDYSEKIVKAV